MNKPVRGRPGRGRISHVRWLVAMLLIPSIEGATPAARVAEESRQYRYVMGTSVQVEAFGGDAVTRQSAIDEAFAAFDEVDRLMSNYRDDSELSLINRSAASVAVGVSDPMFGVLDAARRVSAASSGAFDITVGPLVRLWGFHDKKPHIPSAAELASVRPLVDHRNVLLDAEHRTVRFARPGMELDLGGIAKGFAVEIAADVLRRRGLSGFIDAGGNQYLLGTPPGKRRWSVGIKNPDVRGQVIGVVETGEVSVSTSADSYNYLIADGRTYGHILDPRTLQPAGEALSVTIFSRDGTLADAMSKAVFVLGPSAGIALVDSVPDMSAVVVCRNADGTVGVTVSKRLAGSYRPTSR